MKINKIIGLLTIQLMIILVLFSGIFAQTLTAHQYLDKEETETMIEITEFDDFVHVLDEPYINISKSSSNFGFYYYGGSPEFMITETTYLDLSEYGYITDFNFGITVNYNYIGTMLGRTAARLGSYYWENGTYSGTPEEGLERLLTANTVTDVWDTNLGRHYLQAFPYDVKEEYITDKVLGKTGESRFNVTRISNSIQSNATTEGVISIAHNWFVGVSKPINYILLKFELYPDWTSYVNVTYSELSLSFILNDNTTITTIISPIGFLTPILSLLVSIPIIIQRRRKKKDY